MTPPEKDRPDDRLSAITTEQPEDDRGLSFFRPIQLRKAADEVVLVLIDAIRGGVYDPGDLLPRERDLAAQLGVSMPVLREALDALRRAGIVSVKRGRTGGTRVDTLRNLTEVLRGIDGEAKASIRAVLETRRLLEVEAALLTAARATEAELGELRRLVDALEDSVERRADIEEIRTIDFRFHFCIAQFSGNTTLTDLHKRNLEDLFLVRDSYPFGHVALDLAVRNQRETLEAILRGSAADVRKAMGDHLGALELVYLGEQLPENAGELLDRVRGRTRHRG